jgi:hypothetical protein
MKKIIFLLVCLLDALKAYDLFSITYFLKNMSLNKTYSSPDGISYIKLNYISDFHSVAEGYSLDIVFLFKPGDRKESSGHVNGLVT